MGKVIPLLTPASPLPHKWIKRLCTAGLQRMISKLSNGERVSLITKASSESIFPPSCSPLPPGKVGESMIRGSKTCATLADQKHACSHLALGSGARTCSSCNKDDLALKLYLPTTTLGFMCLLINHRPTGIYCTGDICLSDLIMVEKKHN